MPKFLPSTFSGPIRWPWRAWACSIFHVFVDPERGKDCGHPFTAKQTHQVVLERKVEFAFARVTLTTGTAAQLVIYTSRLMAFRAQDVEATRGNNRVTFA